MCAYYVSCYDIRFSKININNLNLKIMSNKDYSSSYSESAMWQKISKFAKSAGKDVILNVLKLYFASAKGKANAKQIAAIIAAIGYFIAPIDLIPDITPGLGFTDDAGVLASAVATLACCKDSEVVAAARRKLNEWF